MGRQLAYCLCRCSRKGHRHGHRTVGRSRLRQQSMDRRVLLRCRRTGRPSRGWSRDLLLIRPGHLMERSSCIQERMSAPRFRSAWSVRMDDACPHRTSRSVAAHAVWSFCLGKRLSWSRGESWITRTCGSSILDSGRERQLTNFGRDFVIGDFDLSPDGREIVLEREQDNSDIVLIDR
jgi:hypothetical protein